MNLVEVYNTLTGRYVYKAEWPSTWDEMTPRQFRAVAKALSVESDEITARACVIYALMNRPVLALKIQYGELFYLSEYVDFVFSDKPATQKFFLRRTRLGIVPMRGPADNLTDMRTGHFATVETYLQQALAHPQDARYLGRFAATLFLPVWNKRFNDKALARRGRKMAAKPMVWLQAVLLNYIFIRTALARQYPHVFKSPSENEERAAKSRKGARDLGWFGILLKLPGDVFGVLDARAEEPIHNVLTHLELVGQEAEELEREFSKKKRGARG